MKLRISKDLSLPIETVTESIALLAKRGAGKTYAASVLVEEMLKAKLQVVVLDPMHAWWGLRSSADGKGDGFPIAVLGGPKGDVPLEPTGGTLVAELVVDERLSAILDVSPFSKTERRRFVADFLERLYQRNQDAMHVVLEEADLFAPEGKLKRAGDEAMLGAVYDLVRRGRGRGIGSTLITQRSASLSKEVLTQAEILIALRTTGPQDVAAIKEWIRYHGSDEERELVLGSLHELPTGEAFIWWPVEGILKRIQIRERETFDSSATPKPGQAKREPKTLADVDLDALSERMAATIERAKAEDPRELQRRLRDAEKQLRDLEGTVKVLESLPREQAEPVVERVEAPVLNGQLEQLESAIAAMRATADPVVAAGESIRAGAEAIADAIMYWRNRDLERIPRVGRALPDVEGGPRRQREKTAPSRPRPAEARRPRPAATPAVAAGEVSLKPGARRMLEVLASFAPLSLTRDQLSTLAHVTKGGTFSSYLSSLRTQGLIDESGETLAAADAGLELVGTPGAPPTSTELRAVYERVLKPGARRMLDELFNASDPLTREELAERAGVTKGGTFSSYLSKLRTNGLIDERGGTVALSETLFMGERVLA